MDLRWTHGPVARQGAAVATTVALALTALFGMPALDAASVTGVDVGADHITLRFDDAVQGATAFLLAGPNRIAIDVSGAKAGGDTASGGFVQQARQGQYSPGVARIVLDLARPATVRDGRFAEDGRSFTLALRPASAQAFAQATRGIRQSFAPPATFRTAAYVTQGPAVSVTLDPPMVTRGEVVAPRVTGPRGRNRPLVVIDAGHGGHDPGSLSADGRYREKDAALAIARAIRDELVRSGRVRVAMTRDDDRFLILGDRREIARRLKADLFISVHADSAPNGSARGATVYTLSEVASDRVAAQLAAKENKSDVLNGVDLGGENNDVSSILIDLAQRETMNVSSGFASLLQREMSPLVPFKTDFHRFAGLIVLKAPDVPSVLLETGYISNNDDLQQLFSRQYQQNIAIGVRRAVETHFARRLAAR